MSDLEPTPPVPEPPNPARAFLHRCLLVDLEVTLAGRITHIGAILGDRRQSGTQATGLAVLRRFPNPDNEAEDVSRLRCASWEIPLLELVWEDPPAGRHA
jgi:hypothetical protein